MGKVVDFPSIKKDGYTQVPNFFFEQLLNHLTEIELKVYLVIFRATRGYHCWEAEVSYLTLERITGLTHQSVFRAGQGLQQKGFIEKQIDGTTTWFIRDIWSNHHTENCIRCQSHKETSYKIKWSNKETATGMIKRPKMTFLPLYIKKEKKSLKEREILPIDSSGNDETRKKGIMSFHDVEENSGTITPQRPVSPPFVFNDEAHRLWEQHKRKCNEWNFAAERFETEGGTYDEYKRLHPMPILPTVPKPEQRSGAVRIGDGIDDVMQSIRFVA